MTWKGWRAIRLWCRIPACSAVAVSALNCAHPAPRSATPLGAVPPERLERLSRAVNVTRWFASYGVKRSPLFADYLSDGDIAMIRTSGFRAIRLFIDARYLYDPQRPGRPDPTVLSHLDTALGRLFAHDLGVVIVPNALPRRLEDDSAYREGFIRFWGALAEHLRLRDPDRLLFEVVNEPEFQGRPREWLDLQRRLVVEIRRHAPSHTLIASGSNWSSIDGLLEFAPLADPNVIYTFHFYEPATFTHQGASWAGQGSWRDIPFPTDSARCEVAVGAQTEARAARAVERYCRQRWDGAALAARLEQVDQWRRRYRVPVFAGEFGANCRAPREDRLDWIRQVRTGLEQRHIGWALWDFDTCFGLDAQRGVGGRLTANPDVLGALGLVTEQAGR